MTAKRQKVVSFTGHLNLTKSDNFRERSERSKGPSADSWRRWCANLGTPLAVPTSAAQDRCREAPAVTNGLQHAPYPESSPPTLWWRCFAVAALIGSGVSRHDGMADATSYRASPSGRPKPLPPPLAGDSTSRPFPFASEVAAVSFFFFFFRRPRRISGSQLLSSPEPRRPKKEDKMEEYDRRERPAGTRDA